MIAVREWDFEVAARHVVRVEHDTVWGNVVVLLDGQETFRRSRKLWDIGCEHRFLVDGTRCLVRITYLTFQWQYELWVDGRLQ